MSVPSSFFVVDVCAEVFYFYWLLNAAVCVAVCLPDSVLAFHKNGMTGRSLRNGEITQEINDLSRVYRLLGSDKYVVF